MNISQNLNTTLYHGTISEIKKVDVRAGKGYKDFGRGFYLAVSKQQAIGMMHKKYRNVSTHEDFQSDIFCERLYEVKLDEHVLEGLNIKFFAEADMDWLNFVLMCRGNKDTPHNYDMVVGFTADDDTELCIKTYNQGLYGQIGSEKAKLNLLQNLQVENLGIQYFIGKQEVADAVIVSMREINP